ncbi:MAG: GNAT family N-acetyltransferase [Methylovulum sp.]|nr:GNAT family N-acetyltransferase [Methylovulum sp.]
MTTIFQADLSSPAHAGAIIALLNEYAQDPMGGGAELSAFTQTHLIAELKKRQGVYVFLATVAGSPAGLAVCFEGFSTFACKPLLNIHDLMVLGNYRGRGIAKQLLAEAETLAIGLGCCKLTLEVLEGNAVAQAAYKACGFAGYELDPSKGKALFWEKKL